MQINLSRELLGLLYQCVVEKMEHLERTAPAKIGDQLQELELKLSSLFKQ